MNQGRVSVMPSYPAPSWTALEAALTELQDCCQQFQVDVVEVSVTAEASWPLTETEPLVVLDQLSAWVKQYSLELDLMVSTPELLLEKAAMIGVTNVVIHPELLSNEPVTVVQQALDAGFSVSVASTYRSSVREVMALVEVCELDRLQLMGIATIGSQGQPFDKRVLERVRQFRRLLPDSHITVDGSVNETTLPALYAAGVDRVAPGSAIIGAADKCAAYKQLQAKVAA